MQEHRFLEYMTDIRVSLYLDGARGREVGSGTMLQAGRSRVRFPMSLDFLIDLPAALWPWDRFSL
jgi:hypothetical protein